MDITRNLVELLIWREDQINSQRSATRSPSTSPKSFRFQPVSRSTIHERSGSDSRSCFEERFMKLSKDKTAHRANTSSPNTSSSGSVSTQDDSTYTPLSRSRYDEQHRCSKIGKSSDGPANRSSWSTSLLIESPRQSPTRKPEGRGSPTPARKKDSAAYVNSKFPMEQARKNSCLKLSKIL